MTQLAIIVPTVNRPHLLQGLLDSIHDSTSTPHRVYFMVENNDLATHAAVDALIGEHEIIFGDFGCYTASANTGVADTREPYFLVANDDVVFHSGWDAHALALMQDPIRVVGIDQGNGRADCFFLVDRRYLTEQSGTPDAPGEFYHPGYHSQYVDTEFVEVAQARGVWAETHDGLIEHRHWTLGKSAVDATYQLAIASVAPDRQLYENRRHLWAA